jgi:DNA-binding beta-propeller fold protein YncE/DNA-directed RNA polymerase subunit RPC12/RpoP
MSQTFNCPNCGAPLDYQGSDPIIRCPYCSSSVIVPENLRSRPHFSSKPDNFTLSGFGDMGGLVSQARRIKQVKDLAEAGEMDKAVTLYREITGADEFSARQSVGTLASGQPITFSGMPAVSMMSTPSIRVDTKTSQGIGRTIGCFVTALTLTIIAGVLIPVLGSLGIFAAVFSGLQGSGIELPGGIELPVDIPGVQVPAVAGFATQELSFGGEGTGPGLFDDVRAIAVNPANGNIYAANYSDGRVQAFDAQGKFITQWIIPKEVSAPYFGDMAVGRDGTVYIPVFGKLKLFDGEGKPLGEIEPGRDYIDNLDIAADGTLVAIANGEDILWLTPEGEIIQRVDDAVSTVSGDSELSALVAVDGMGNVYVLGRFNNAVFVFDSKGKYVNRFGSDGDEAGQFRAPLAIEVDGKGRVFVSDIKGIQVFGNDGRYINVFKVQFAVAYGLAFDDQGKLYITTGNKTVEKYSIKE